MVAWLHDGGKGRWGALGLALAVACGGSSKRNEDDGASGSGSDVAVGGIGGISGTGGTTVVGGTGALGGTGPLGGTAGSAAVSGQGGTGPLGGTAGSAAVSGQGGSAAVSGQGGSGGDACTLGDSCRIEGSECRPNPDVVECCPTVYACESAQWVQKPSECGSTPCPASIPEAGSACGPCAAICPYDMCASGEGGNYLEVNCTGTEWYIAELACLACCEEDGDCDSDFCVRGRCASRNHIGCFRDDECDTGEVCAGVRLCPCGSPEGCKGDEWGACVPDGIGCCVVDADCGEDETCVAGVCKTNVSGGDLCWRNEDCEFGCTINFPCPCGQSCPIETTGKCWRPL